MKYIKQPTGSFDGYDENSEIFKALSALPKSRRPVFLADTDAGVVAYLAEQAEAAKPKEVSNRQFKEALIRQGKDDAAEATINGLPSGTPEEVATKKVVTNLYYNSNTFQRTNQTLLSFAPALGLDSPADIDAFFAYAATL